MLNKRGQGLSTNAIILIILGVVVLVVLIIGFTVGFDKLAPFLGNENIDGVVQSCSTACATQSVFGFCTQERNLVDDKGPVDTATGKTCNELSEDPDIESKYGIAKCPNLCPATASEATEEPVGQPTIPTTPPTGG